MLPTRGPAERPAGYSLFEWTDSTRDHLPNPARTGGSAPSGNCDAGGSEPQNGKSDSVDQGELREAITGGRSGRNRGHGCVNASSPFSSADRYEPSSVSKTTSAASSTRPHAPEWSRRCQRGIRGRIRKHQPIQSRIQSLFRATTYAGHPYSPRTGRSAPGVSQQSAKHHVSVLPRTTLGVKHALLDVRQEVLFTLREFRRDTGSRQLSSSPIFTSIRGE